MEILFTLNTKNFLGVRQNTSCIYIYLRLLITLELLKVRQQIGPYLKRLPAHSLSV